MHSIDNHIKAALHGHRAQDAENNKTGTSADPRYYAEEEIKGMAAALGATGYTVPPTYAVHDPAAVAHAA
ncbi:hypothetical protein HDU87_005788 [Geranomyces variabilis]|uniref:Uncharacterized protein n=1 Tax=Geranomyces variabilis TaxID=109894 RepID=A0AAD5TGE8_9FUNG|nr:hypothetical protein HDU87_005788 [Geranomyces variabilis]